MYVDPIGPAVLTFIGYIKTDQTKCDMFTVYRDNHYTLEYGDDIKTQTAQWTLYTGIVCRGK